MTTGEAYEKLAFLHREMCSTGANDAQIAWFDGVVKGLFLADVLKIEDITVWAARVRVCPGHECQASWCAYCGDINATCPPGRCDPCDERRREAADAKQDEINQLVERLS
jgi:hypothetical protein